MLKSNRLVATSAFVKFAALTGVLLVAGCGKKKEETGGTPAPAGGSSTAAAAAGDNGMPGVTATEIKIGQTMPYSGPAVAYGVIGKTEVDYFKMINEKGGINGRKVTLLSLDDSYSPDKAKAQTRKLVEDDGVAFMFNSVGTPSNTAVQPYLNQKGVPQLFIATGADKWANPKENPWTIGWQPSYRTEAKVYARYLMKEKPDAKLCVLHQNDDFGKDYVAGLKDALGDKADKMIVKVVSYEVADPTVDSQIVTLQGAGCDTFLAAVTPKAGVNAIRKVADLGWKPTFLISNVSSSITAVLTPAGLDKSTGIITGLYLKDPNDPAMATDPGMKEYRDFMAQSAPELNALDGNAVYGYGAAVVLAEVLKRCGNDLSRKNIMKQATNLDKFVVPVAINGILFSTSDTDFRPFEQMQLAKFDGKSFQTFGEILSGG